MMTNNMILKPCAKLFCLLITVVFINSCANKTVPWPDAPPSPQENGNGDNGNGPTAHVWQYLYAYGDEELDYATYSYVLVGRDENNQTATTLYFELVKEIRGSTVSAERLPEHVSNTHFNLFLIPAKDNISTEHHKPNYELSKLLLAALSTASPLKFSLPGPYIITLYQPISFGKQDEVADIMYIDLTNTHQSAIPEVVRTYKSKLLGENLSGIEKLHSLRLSLLNLALIAEDNIGFARTAYAELRSAFFN